WRCSDPPSEGRGTPRNADFYKVPLRTYLWLVVPAALGAVIGLGLAHRGASGPASRQAAAPSPSTPPLPLCSVLSPPERVYRPAHPHIGLTPISEELATATSGVAVHNAYAGGGSQHGTATNSVVPFNANPREFAQGPQSSSSGEAPPSTAPDPT